MIKTFPYSFEDKVNKPNVDKNWIKLTGNASQIWCMLRLLPFFIGDKILNYDDEAWCMALKLSVTVEMILAPVLNTEDMACLSTNIREYIAFCNSVFPKVPLRP